MSASPVRKLSAPEIALLATLLACDGDVASVDTACDLDYALTWDTFGDGFFHTWCAACHSVNAPQRFDAPDGVDFDSEDEVRSWEARIRARVIEDQTMPLGGGISAEELRLLRQYLDCGL